MKSKRPDRGILLFESPRQRTTSTLKREANFYSIRCENPRSRWRDDVSTDSKEMGINRNGSGTGKAMKKESGEKFREFLRRQLAN